MNSYRSSGQNRFDADLARGAKTAPSRPPLNPPIGPSPAPIRSGAARHPRPVHALRPGLVRSPPQERGAVGTTGLHRCTAQRRQGTHAADSIHARHNSRANGRPHRLALLSAFFLQTAAPLRLAPGTRACPLPRLLDGGLVRNELPRELRGSLGTDPGGSRRKNRPSRWRHLSRCVRTGPVVGGVADVRLRRLSGGGERPGFMQCRRTSGDASPACRATTQRAKWCVMASFLLEGPNI